MLLFELQPESPIYDLPDRNAIRLYFYLLTLAKRKRNGHVYVCDSDLPKEAGRTSDELKALIEHGYVKWPGNLLVLSDDDGELYANKANPFKKEMEELEELFSQFNASTSMQLKSNDIKEQVSKALSYLQMPSKFLIKAADVMVVWKGIYVLVFEMQCRDFTGKEIGQFKSLVNLYNPIIATKLCILYLLESGVPSIGQLLTKKDEFYHKLAGTKTTTNAKNRSYF